MEGVKAKRAEIKRQQVEKRGERNLKWVMEVEKKDFGLRKNRKIKFSNKDFKYFLEDLVETDQEEEQAESKPIKVQKA